MGIKKPLTALSLLALVGCSGAFGTMDGIMQSWHGAPLDDVITQWGYPSGQQDIAGRKIYIWDKKRILTLPQETTGQARVIGNTAYLSTTTTGGTSFWSCQRILEVNDKNIVVGSQWQGNNCPYAELGQYSSWRRKAN